MKKPEEILRNRKLVDKLVPKDEYGPLLGFLGTTFELQPEFFETDFLPILLDLGAWNDLSWTSRIAIEKKLSELEAAAVFMDASRYRGRPQSFRVELRPVYFNRGAKLHAKMTLLVYQECVQLLVGSANLTENGYRKNREVAGILTVTQKLFEQAPLVRAAIEGFREQLGHWSTETSDRVCTVALESLSKWAGPRKQEKNSWFTWSGPDKPLWKDFLGHWPKRQPIHRITIVSPFWSEADKDGPLSSFLHRIIDLGVLAGDAKVRLLTEAKAEGDGCYRPVLPESSAGPVPDLGKVKIYAQPVDPTVPKEEVQGVEGFEGIRPLHAKVVLMEGEVDSLVYLGSANFTRSGWGFLPKKGIANLEAGLVLRRTGRLRAALGELVPAGIGDEIELTSSARRLLAKPLPKEEIAPWPSFIDAITLVPSRGHTDQVQLQVELVPELVRGRWELRHEDGGDSLGGGRILLSGERGTKAKLQSALPSEDLEQILLEKQLLVRWWACTEGCTYPVNVSLAAQERLPIAPGSSTPGENLLLAYYQGQIAFEELFPQPGTAIGGDGNSVSEPTNVNTTNIQSYQVREFVEALQGIRDDLSKAASSGATMRLALVGPVSPVALARAIRDARIKGSRTPIAAGFQLVEIMCCVAEARHHKVSRQHRKAWLGFIREAEKRISGMLAEIESGSSDLLSGSRPFQKYRNTLRRYCRNRGKHP